MFTLTQKCPSTSRYLKYANHPTFTFVLCVTFDLPLTTEACKTIATAIVGSRLDYCNSLLVGTSTSNLARLQLVQNTLARVVAQKSRFCHISPVPFRFALASHPSQNKLQIGYYYFQGTALSAAILSRYPHSTLHTIKNTSILFLFNNMHSSTKDCYGKV